MNKSILFLCAVVFALNCQGQFSNVLISNTNNPEEVTICINPKNTNQVVGAANLDNVFHSNDGGLTWSFESLADPVNGIWGDPIVFTDTSGNFFYAHLANPPADGSWVDRIVFTKSIDGGISWWPSGTSTGKNGTKVQDKEGIIVNQATNEIYVTWTQFDEYGTSNPTDSTIILFSKSIDVGLTWSAPIRISKHAGNCVDGDSTVEGAIPTIGPNGEIFVFWTGPNGLVFNKSLDDGVTWLAEERHIIDIPGGWNYNIGGLERCNGLPQVVTDLSGGPNTGTMYINWTDQRNGSDDTDVWLIKSSDGGTTWSPLIRVNNDVAGKQQFLTWMTVDQVTGNLYFVFYDRRNFNSTSDSTDVYLAKSVDGGITCTNVKINENSFIPDPSVFFGDYISISAVNDMVRPIWMAFDVSGLSVWTAIIDGTNVGIHETNNTAFSPVGLSQNSPNPFNQNTWIKFELNVDAKVDLVVNDVLGNEVAVLYKNEQFKQGSYDYIFNANSYHLSPGIYCYSLKCSEYALTKKMSIY